MRAAPEMPPSSIEDVDEDEEDEEDWAWSTSEAVSKSIAALLGMKRSYCDCRAKERGGGEGGREREVSRGRSERETRCIFSCLFFNCQTASIFPNVSSFLVPQLLGFRPLFSHKKTKRTTTYRLLLPVGRVAERGGGEEGARGGGGSDDRAHFLSFYRQKRGEGKLKARANARKSKQG